MSLITRLFRLESGEPLKEKTADALAAYLMLKSKNTQRQYRSVINEFETWMAGRHRQLYQATPDDACAYAAWVVSRPGQHRRGSNREEHCTRATALHKCFVLKGYFAELGCPGGRNPFTVACAKIGAAETGEKRPTEAVSAESVRRLFSSIVEQTISDLRDRAFVALLFGGGLRISEALGLQMADICRDEKNCWLVLRETKAQKQQEQVIPPWAAEPIMRYRAARAAAGAANSDPLLVGHSSWREPPRRLAPKTGWLLFKRLCHRAGLSSALSPHSARATAATRGLESGWTYEEARIFLRQASLRMVSTYDKRRTRRQDAPGLKLSFT